jgi:hypothetical protein
LLQHHEGNPSILLTFDTGTQEGRVSVNGLSAMSAVCLLSQALHEMLSEMSTGEDRSEPISEFPCPDCAAGKHANCDGGAWNMAEDAPGLCHCYVNGHKEKIA